MRRALDRLYGSAAVLAAVFMVGTLAMVTASIVDRFVSLPLKGMDMYAGYAMAGAGFLSLAHTFKRSEHIRVTVLLNAVGLRVRHGMELWALAAAAAISAAFAYYSVRLVVNSWLFHDVSTGNDATPLWIPQLTMAIGVVVLFIALLDELVLELRGLRVAPSADEPLRVE